MRAMTADATIDVRGESFSFQRWGEQWSCRGVTVGSIPVEEITVEDAEGFPDWAAASMAALVAALPGAVKRAREALGDLARQRLPQMGMSALVFELVNAELLEGERFELALVLSSPRDPFPDTYGVWGAQFARGQLAGVRREAV